MLNREWQKLWYSLPKFVGLFLLSFIPVIGQTIIPVLTFLFTCWMMAIQYCDYPFDNHKIFFWHYEKCVRRKTFSKLDIRGINYPLYGIADREPSDYSCGGLRCNGDVGGKLSLTIKI